MESKREVALSWWNKLPDITLQKISKSSLCEKYYGSTRIHKSLTDVEIEFIYDSEGVVSNEERMYSLEELKKAYEEGESKGMLVARNMDYYMYISIETRFNEFLKTL